MKNKDMIGHIAAFITIVIWGTTFISTKILLTVFSPIEILFMRFFIGYIALWCAYPCRLKLFKRKEEWYFVAAGLSGVTLYYLFENIALTYTQASNVGVIISIAPFFTAIFASLFLHDSRPRFRFFIGLIIALSGIVLISFSNETLHLNPLGDILAMIAAIIWAAYSTISKKIAEFGYHTIASTRRTFFYGLIFMIPVLCIMGFDVKHIDLFHPIMQANLLFLGLGASALCFVTWNLAVRKLGSIKTSVYIYMVPVITAITSAFVLHESISWRSASGIALTLVGLFLSQKRRGEKKYENTE